MSNERRHNKSHGHGTINRDIQINDPKWRHILSPSGVISGVIQHKETGTLMERSNKRTKSVGFGDWVNLSQQAVKRRLSPGE